MCEPPVRRGHLYLPRYARAQQEFSDSGKLAKVHLVDSGDDTSWQARFHESTKSCYYLLEGAWNSTYLVMNSCVPAINAYCDQFGVDIKDSLEFALCDFVPFRK